MTLQTIQIEMPFLHRLGTVVAAVNVVFPILSFSLAGLRRWGLLVPDVRITVY